MIDYKCVAKVDDDQMNAEHAKSFEELNQLEAKLLGMISGDDSGRSGFIELLEQFIADTKEHFMFEQEQMVHTEFPAIKRHIESHEQLIQQLELEFENWKSSQNHKKMLELISTTLPHWLINHIVTMDTVTARHMKQYDTSKIAKNGDSDGKLTG